MSCANEPFSRCVANQVARGDRRKTNIKEEEEGLKTLIDDFEELKADRGNPKFADALVILKSITGEKSRLCDAKASL